MSLAIAFFKKIGYVLLNICRAVRRALCCRRRRHESGMILPLTIQHDCSKVGTKKEYYDFQDWNAWNNSELESSPISCGKLAGDNGQNSQSAVAPIVPPPVNSPSASYEEDFFKDMVPQFRKPKKLVVRSFEDADQSHVTSNRLAMNPTAFSPSVLELGVLVDNQTNWETCESLDEPLDADSLIKENRLAEREKRIADHQRRNMEKQSLRASKHISFNKHSYRLAETKDKTKYS